MGWLYLYLNMPQSRLNGQAMFFRDNIEYSEYHYLLNFIFLDDKRIVTKEEFKSNIPKKERTNLDEQLRMLCRAGFIERVRPDKYKRTYITKNKRNNLEQLNNLQLNNLLANGKRSGYVYSED